MVHVFDCRAGSSVRAGRGQPRGLGCGAQTAQAAAAGRRHAPPRSWTHLRRSGAWLWWRPCNQAPGGGALGSLAAAAQRLLPQLITPPQPPPAATHRCKAWDRGGCSSAPAGRGQEARWHSSSARRASTRILADLNAREWHGAGPSCGAAGAARSAWYVHSGRAGQARCLGRPSPDVAKQRVERYGIVNVRACNGMDTPPPWHSTARPTTCMQGACRPP